MSRLYIGVGSNKGDRQKYIEKALEYLRADENIVIKKASEIIETEAEGNNDHPMFLNSVIELETFLDPYTLFKKLKNIERLLGRKEGQDKWSPRVIDLDILLFDDLVIKGKNLKIPHPLMHKRYFVLKPLSEIAPLAKHPILDKTISELLNELETVNEADKNSGNYEQCIPDEAQGE